MDILKTIKTWLRKFACFFGFHKYILKSGRPLPMTITDPSTGESSNATLFIMTCPYCGQLRYDIVIKDERIKAEVM